MPNKISCLFSFLPEISLFQEHIPSTYTPDLRISVDTSTPERSPLRDRATKQPIINVDHHPSNAPRGTVYLINDTISSCCELITFLLQSNDPNRITPQIATFLLM